MSDAQSEDREVIAAFMAATTASFQVLVRSLEESGALERGEFATAMLAYMETASRLPNSDDMMLAMMHNLRLALLD